MAVIQRSLYLYSMHGRSNDRVIDYPAFMERLASAPSASRQATVREETVAITRIERRGSQPWILRFVAGSATSGAQTFFNTATGRESQVRAPRNSIPVRSVLTFVDPDRRYVVIERKRPGLSGADVARALGAIGEAVEFAPNLLIDLNPVTAESFLDELESLERIRKAAIVVARPNFDWNENATSLTQYAAESNGGTAEVEITASRRGSLSRDRGIVKDIRDLVTKTITPIKRVKVVGQNPGESRDRTISAAQHQERHFASLDTADPEAVQEVELERSASALISQVGSQESPPDD